jgi:hypothetical protein
MSQRMLRHADSRSTERYAKLGVQPKTGLANTSIDNGIWRGGRDSNLQPSAVTPRKRRDPER